MKRLATIILCGALAGCAAADYSPLQRDLAELASLPNKLDSFVRTKTARTLQPTEPVAVQTETAAVQTETAAAATVSPPPAPAPSIFEKLKIHQIAATQPVPVAPPGAYDQIPEPLPVENPLARPPWEALAEAGPNAHNELDLETLYGPGNIPAELQEPESAPEQEIAVAADLAPPDQALEDAVLPPEQAESKAAKPGEVVIKAVAVPAVKGARGQGNGELTSAMRSALKQAGWPVLNAPRKDALTVQGNVAIGQPHGANQSVKIVWDVLTPDGKRLGDLKQDNAVPAGSLDQSWGENAQYAADAAAEGIFKLIQKYR